jgi:hypothetical protein
VHIIAGFTAVGGVNLSSSAIVNWLALQNPAGCMTQDPLGGRAAQCVENAVVSRRWHGNKISILGHVENEMSPLAGSQVSVRAGSKPGSPREGLA